MIQATLYDQVEFDVYVQEGPNDKSPVDGLTVGSFAVYIRRPAEGLVEVTGAIQFGIGFGTGLYNCIIPTSYLTKRGIYTIVVLPPSSGSPLEANHVDPMRMFVAGTPDSNSGTIMSAISTVRMRVSGLASNVTTDDNHWARSYLRLASGTQRGQQSRISSSSLQIISMTAASYDDVGNAAGDHFIFNVGVFAGYTWVSGDKIRITGGTGITPGVYEIASKVNDNGILLTSSAGSDAVDLAAESLTEIIVFSAFTSAPADEDRVAIISE